jgi:hypothetical protein
VDADNMADPEAVLAGILSAWMPPSCSNSDMNEASTPYLWSSDVDYWSSDVTAVVSLVTGVCREIGDTWGRGGHRAGRIPDLVDTVTAGASAIVVAGLWGGDRAERAEDTGAGWTVARPARFGGDG